MAFRRRGSILNRYILSYFGITLLACAIVGFVLLYASLDRLESAARNELQGRLGIAADDLVNQYDILEDIANQIKTTVYYRPTFFQRNAFYETELVEDLAKYAGHSPLTGEYFLYFVGAGNVYRAWAKTLFSVYASGTLGVEDVDAFKAQLDSLTQFTILPLDGLKCLLVFPIRINGSLDPSGDACVAFVLTREALDARLVAMTGRMRAPLWVYCDGIPLLPPADAASAAEPGEAFLRAQSGRFAVMVNITQSGMYESIRSFWLFAVILTGSATLLMLGVAAVLAYQSYRPIQRVASKYQAQGAANEIESLDAMLHAMLNRNQLTLAELAEKTQQLDRQRDELRQQLLSRLLGGEWDATQQPQMDMVHLRLPHPFFCVLAVTLARGPIEDAALRAQIEEFCDESLVMYAVRLNEDRKLAVLLNMAQDTQAEEAAELVRALCDSLDCEAFVDVGAVCDSPARLPVSFFAALSATRRTDPILPSVEAAVSGGWYRDEYTRGIEGALAEGNPEKALSLLNAFGKQLEEQYPSLLIQRCIYADVANAMMRAARQRGVLPSQEQLSAVLLAYNATDFVQAMAVLIRAIAAPQPGGERSQGEAMLRHIQDRALDYDLSLEQVAAAFGVSGRHVSATVKALTGASYKEYVTQLRIRHAQRLLSEEGLSVAETSARVCYVSVPHFIKVFKQVTGTTPARYKKQG